jgi:hypothetical protein
MTEFNSIISFRIVLALGILMLLNSNSYAQTKKEQVKSLRDRLDILIEAQRNNKVSFDKNRFELENAFIQMNDELYGILSFLYFYYHDRWGFRSFIPLPEFQKSLNL